MHEILAMLHGYGRAVWIRRWWAAAAAWVVCLGAWAVILALPEKYEASARVYVDARTPLRPVLQGIAIEQDFESQLALVREALLSRPQLEAVASKTGLDARITTQAAKDALITGLQTQIIVFASAIATRPGGPQADATYTISYRHPDRETSVEVVRTLLDNFVEGTLSGNRSGADEAQTFLASQIGQLETRLAESEARLAEFKKRNVGMLPGESGDYFSRLETEMRGLQKAETDLAIAVSRREELRRQLAAARQYVPGTSSNTSSGSGQTLDISNRIQESEARLEELLLRFTDRHPEVVALRQAISELRSREAEELAELSKGGAGTGAIRSLSVNPVYQSIQVLLNEVEVELASIRGAAAQHKQEIENLQAFVDSAPEVEQEFSRLNRDYEVVKLQYEQLVARREQARVTDNAAQDGIVRFEVIEPPRAGLAPVWPPRQTYVALALLLGLGAGVAFALLPRLLRPAFDDSEVLAGLTGLPVLGTVSLLKSPGSAARLRREILHIAVAGLALVSVGGVLVVFGEAGARAISRVLT